VLDERELPVGSGGKIGEAVHTLTNCLKLELYQRGLVGAAECRPTGHKLYSVITWGARGSVISFLKHYASKRKVASNRNEYQEF
jgi:hypothetical protein